MANAETADERAAGLKRWETSLREREAAVALREADVGQKPEVVTHNAEIRQANESLIFSSLQAHELCEAAEVAQRRQEEFLAMLSHELRGPLHPISTAVEILGRLKYGQPVPARLLDLIKRQVAQMARLLDDLLEVSRVTHGKITLKRRSVDISEVLRQVAEAIAEQLSGREQMLTLELPDGPLWVDGDPVRLTQVFHNLLQNAIKYTPTKGSIKVCARAGDGSIEIRVMDNGIGISPQALGHVFELFAQDEPTADRSQGGLGIGLTVAFRMVELHAGTIRVISEGRGKGSEFVVTLPLLVEQAPAAKDTGSLRPADPPPSARILIIEDNVVAAETLAELLECCGHAVQIAHDGPSGLNKLDTFQPQIVLCDIGLPGMDGYEVAARVRERSQPPVPVMVALTGYGGASDRERAKAAGFDHHLVKPADLECLLGIVASAMRTRS
jgi:signal transduction histidine kinase/CheY-like chemotaxis protein